MPLSRTTICALLSVRHTCNPGQRNEGSVAKRSHEPNYKERKWSICDVRRSQQGGGSPSLPNEFTDENLYISSE